MTLRIAIIGGVAGGAGAAAAARRANESAQIDLFEAGPYISFANCGLPYYLSGEIDSRDKLLVTSPQTLKQRFNIDVHVQHRVDRIDRDNHVIHVTDLAAQKTTQHPYDRLVIATGAQSLRPPTPGLDHPRVAECRTIDDVDKLAALTADAPDGAPVLVIGGGFIGLEVAEALVNRGLSVTVIDLAPQILPPMDPEIAAAGQQELEAHGVTVITGVKADKLEHGDHESVAVLSDGRRVPFAFAVLSIGVSPWTSLAKEAGLAIGATGGLVVDDYQRTSDPDIFAAGDVTELLYWPTQSRMKLALAGPANKQARAAGVNAASDVARLTVSGAAGTSIVRIFDLAIGMTGLSEKFARSRKMSVKTIYTRNGHHAGYFPGAQPLTIKLLFSPDDGRVLGGQVFGREGVDKRLDVLATAIQARFTVHQLADLDLAYAPPFGAAKDPIIIAGMVASNVVTSRTQTITPAELAGELASDKPPLVIDVRSPKEHAAGRIEGSLNLPLETLRATHEQIAGNRRVVVHCAVGYRGYVAERLLKQRGHADVRNLTGGFHAWQLWRAATPSNSVAR